MCLARRSRSFPSNGNVHPKNSRMWILGAYWPTLGPIFTARVPPKPPVGCLPSSTVSLIQWPGSSGCTFMALQRAACWRFWIGSGRWTTIGRSGSCPMGSGTQSTVGCGLDGNRSSIFRLRSRILSRHSGHQDQFTYRRRASVDGCGTNNGCRSLITPRFCFGSIVGGSLTLH